jgi:hypothetical protein
MELPALNATQLLDFLSLIIDAKLLIASILALGDAPDAQQVLQLDHGAAKIPTKKCA